MCNCIIVKWCHPIVYNTKILLLKIDNLLLEKDSIFANAAETIQLNFDYYVFFQLKGVYTRFEVNIYRCIAKRKIIVIFFRILGTLLCQHFYYDFPINHAKLHDIFFSSNLVHILFKFITQGDYFFSN